MTPKLRYRVTRRPRFWWLPVARYRQRTPRRPYQDTLILPDANPFPYLRSSSVPEHYQKRSSERSLVLPSDSMPWWQSKFLQPCYGQDISPIFHIPCFYHRVHRSSKISLLCRGALAHQRALRRREKQKSQHHKHNTDRKHAAQPLQ